MDDLLSTSQAAELLGVSEASVRRWSDRGSIPVQRVGKRRERRFRVADLDRFGRTLSQAGSTRPGAAVEGVLLGGAPVEPYTHLTTFYGTDSGRLRLTAPFLQDGIRRGEPTFLLAGGEVLQAYLTRLRAALGPDLDAALDSKRLQVRPAPGKTVAESLAFWENEFWAAVEAGHRLIRGVGEMVSEREIFESEADMLAYESALNTLTTRFPCIVVCQYDVREFSGLSLLTALKAHPDVFGRPLRSVIV